MDLISSYLHCWTNYFRRPSSWGKSNSSIAGVSLVHKNRRKKTANRRKLVVAPGNGCGEGKRAIDCRENKTWKCEPRVGKEKPKIYLTIHPRSGSADFVWIECVGLSPRDPQHDSESILSMWREDVLSLDKLDKTPTSTWQFWWNVHSTSSAPFFFSFLHSGW